MRSPSVVILTVLIAALCFYDLSFTWKARQIGDASKEASMNPDGTTDWKKKQIYEDSLWNKEVFLGKTYKQVKEKEINLGLDLQGGMHVTLEVSPIDILRALAGGTPPPAFEQAIVKAKEKQKTSQASFTDLFFEAMKASPEVKLVDIFATASNKGRISFNSTEEEIKDAIEREVEDAIGRAEQIIKTRIDKFGVTSPNIQRVQGTGRIQIELPGVDNPTRVRKLLQGVAQLEFYEVFSPEEYSPIISNVNTFLVKKQKAAKLSGGDTTKLVDNKVVATDTTKKKQDDALIAKDTTKKQNDDLIAGDTSKSKNDSTANAANEEMSDLFKLLRNFSPLTYEATDTAKINALFDQEDVRGMMPNNLKPAWNVKTYTGTDGKEYATLNMLKSRRGEPALGGDVIIDANQTYDEIGQPDVSMQMNAEGARDWKKITRDNKGRQIAIVLDGYVYSAPNVREEIAGGRSSISGGFTVEEALDLANILKAGKLPAPTRIVEEAVVGPTLGFKAQAAGLISAGAGLIIVMIFMFAYYSKGGLISDLALLFNVFFIIGILTNLHAALTLPGIAGIVLTMGMSVDANVLIFERIREERRNGASLMNSIDLGYDRALWTIIDSNLTTFITAFFLYILGSGPVKGFAITLMIGIACSFFSAVFITREIVSWMTKKGEDSKITFSSALADKAFNNSNFPFLAKRKMAYLFSSAIIAVGMVLIAIQGLNLGVDFKGGRSYQVSFAKSFTATDLKVALSGGSLTGSDVQVKSFGNDQTFKITTNYLVDEESDEADQKVLGALVSGLEAFSGEKYSAIDKEPAAGQFTIPSTAKVGATIADDITSSATYAIVASLAGIFLYIWVRFRRWRFGIGAIVALMHDVLIVFSAFAIARALGISYEIDQVFVAAMLTVIGYSINDTVVVFDRIREYLAMERTELEATMNDAMNSTLSRTLITSLTTLLVVVVLFLFGGEVLRGFSFALLIGIGFGTYSSIFIATPVVYDAMLYGKVGLEDLKEERYIPETDDLTDATPIQ